MAYIMSPIASSKNLNESHTLLHVIIHMKPMQSNRDIQVVVETHYPVIYP
ncbi:MAG: hypothetical protein MUO59_03645 [Actinobacteria bacterium]|nr:hypothetical protein [Actinomycetota bacterium]